MSTGALRVATALLAAGLAACGGGEAPPAAAPAEKAAVTGSVTKGPLRGATVKFFRVDVVTGSPTTLVTSVVTDASGNFVVTGLPAGELILAKTSGGSYVDESDPDTSAARRTITFAASDFLEALLPAGATSIAITPYSMALYKKAFIQAGGGNFANVYAAVLRQAETAFGFDPVRTLPADPLTGTGGSAGYAILLGASAQAINAIAFGAGHYPGYADVIAFVADFADGPLGAANLADEIRRFRNNNIGVYAGVAVPVVDEALLSKPAAVPNTAPTISAIADQVIGEDTATGALAFTVADAEDPDTSLTLAGTSSDPALVPDGNIVFGGSGANRTVTVTPAANGFGSATITVTVTDTDGGVASAPFPLTVTGSNDAPIIDSSAPAAATEDTLYTYSATVNDPDGPSPTWSLGMGHTCGGSINASSGTFAFTPAGPVPPANCVIQVQVSDGGAPVTQSATVSITAVNDAPVAVDDSASTPEDTVLTVAASSLATNDTDADGPGLTVTAVGNAVNGSVNLASGTVGFTPALNFNGTATFEYTVSDGSLTDTGLVTVTVTPVNDAPQGLDTTVQTVQGLTYVFSDLDFGFSDPSDVPANNFLAVKIPALPVTGLLVLNDGVSDNAVSPGQFIAVLDIMLGRLKFIPNPGESGLAYAQFPFQVQDNGGIANGGVDLDGVARTLTIDVLAQSGTPWQPMHLGDFDAGVNTSQVKLSWPVTAGHSYRICVTTDPTTDVNSCTATVGNQEFVNIASSPFLVTGLTAGKPVYFSLQNQTLGNQLVARTAARPNVWGVDNTVNAIALGADGTRYVGGGFTSAAVISGAGVTLNSAAGGSVGHALAFPEVLGFVLAATPDGNGGWYIGGGFTSVGGQARLNLAQVNARGQVTAWNPGASNVVYALAVDAGVIYAGGSFTSAGGGTGTQATRNRLAAFDTSGSLTTWDPGAANTVKALAVNAGVIYAGGFFNTAGGGTGTLAVRNQIAAFDTAGNLTGWNPGASSAVNALVVNAGVIYAGGEFTVAGGSTRNYVAAFDTLGALTSWNPGANNFVYALAVDGGVIYAGGSFTSAGGQSRSFLAALNNTTGAAIAWNPGADNSVRTLAADAGVIYAGGGFTGAGGGTGSTPRSSLAAFDTSGNLMAWNPGADTEVDALAVSAGVVYAGGFFTSVGVQPRGHLAAFDPGGNLTGWNPGTNFGVSALAVDAGVIYAGGGFNLAGGSGAPVTTTRNGLAAFNTSGTLTSWDPGLGGGGGSALALAVDAGVIYAGGTFTNAGADTTGGTGGAGATRNYLAAFNAAGALTSWDPGAQTVVNALAVNAGVIYAGGEFTLAGAGTTGGGSLSRFKLAAFNTSGALLPWNPTGAAQGVNALIVHNNLIYTGGDSTNTSTRLAAFDTSGVQTAWSPLPNGAVYAVAVDAGVIYASGAFNVVGGQSRSFLAALNNTTGDATSWNPGSDGAAFALAVDAGVIHAGGGFTQVGTPVRLRNRLASFDIAGNVVAGPDLALDLDFDGLSTGQEYALLTDPDRADSDGDGLTDFAEVNRDGNPGTYVASTSPTGDTNPNDPDTDNDDVGDGIELEVEIASNPNSGNTVWHVDCATGLNGSTRGLSWSDPLLNNGGVDGVEDHVGAGGGASAATVFVLYKGGTTCDRLDFADGPARQFIALVGSVGPAIYLPADPPNTVFDAGGLGSVVAVSNGNVITLRSLDLFNGNAGAGPGGGIFINGPAANVGIREMSIHNNSASDGAGAAVIGSGAFMLANDSRFFSNIASAPSIGGRGGGIYAGGGAVIDIRNSRFLSNQANNLAGPAPTNGGGGVYAEGNSTSVTIDNSVFADNTAKAGPGGGLNAIDIAAVNVRHSQFLSNSSTRPGGGLHVHQNVGAGAATTVFDNLFVGNATTDASTEGGAIEIEQGTGTMQINSNTIAYNQMTVDAATGFGGGVSIAPVNGTVFRHNIVWFNDNATVTDPFTPQAGDNAFFGAGPAPAPAGNNVNDTGAFGNVTQTNPQFTEGFYLVQASNVSVNGGIVPVGDVFNFAEAPYTTNITGTADSGNVDLGFHRRGASAGSFDAVAGPAGVNMCGGPQSVVFTPSFANAPGGEPGHLIVVEATTLPGVLTMTSRTTLDPRSNGSRVARDLGDGRYAVTLGGGLVNGPATFTIYADQQPTPRTLSFTVSSPC